MKQELKSGIFIEGFDTKEQLYNFKDELCVVGENLPYLYLGKTSEISEIMAKEYVDWMFWDEIPERRRFYNYGIRSGVSFPYLMAKESIQSACDKKYCIIYKTK